MKSVVVAHSKSIYGQYIDAFGQPARPVAVAGAAAAGAAVAAVAAVAFAAAAAVRSLGRLHWSSPALAHGMVARRPAPESSVLYVGATALKGRTGSHAQDRSAVHPAGGAGLPV